MEFGALLHTNWTEHDVRLPRNTIHMNVYRMTYIRGRDRDDWREIDFIEDSMEGARRMARALVPHDHRVRKIEFIKTIEQ